MTDEFSDTTIYARDLLTKKARNRDTLLTIIMWALYAYLWLPLISLIAWWLGIRFAYGLVERAGGPANLVHLLFWFGIFLLIIAIAVIGWSRIQMFMFKSGERRKRGPVLTKEQEIAYWEIDEQQFSAVRDGRNMLVDLDEDGRLVKAGEKPAFE